MKKEVRVPIKGSVSQKTAEAMKRGVIKSNNGLRMATGRGSLYPEQPDVQLDDSSAFLEELKVIVKEAIKDEVYELTVYTVRCHVIPRLENYVQGLLVNNKKKSQTYGINQLYAGDMKHADKKGKVIPIADYYREKVKA